MHKINLCNALLLLHTPVALEDKHFPGVLFSNCKPKKTAEISSVVFSGEQITYNFTLS